MFSFKQFTVDDSNCGMKVGTDGVLLGAWTEIGNAARILDAGCGSGLIALMIAQRSPEVMVTGIEIDPDAASDASANAAGSMFSNRIEIICDNYMSMVDRKFDLIVSNPPFFTESLHSPRRSRASARHEGEFGIEVLLRTAPAFLNEGGSLSFIAPASRDSEIEFLAELSRLHLSRKCSVRSVEGKKPFRTLWQLSTAEVIMPQISYLSIRNTDGSVHEDYHSLTKDFYL